MARKNQNVNVDVNVENEEIDKSNQLRIRAAQFGPEASKMIEQIWELVSQIAEVEQEFPFNIVEVQSAISEKIVAQRRKYILETGADRKQSRLQARKAKLMEELAKLSEVKLD